MLSRSWWTKISQMSRHIGGLPRGEGEEDVVESRPGQVDRARLHTAGVQSTGELDQDAVALLDGDAQRSVTGTHLSYGGQAGQRGSCPCGVTVDLDGDDVTGQAPL